MDIYVECSCLNCGNKWSSKVWTGNCPMCGSHKISQNAKLGNQIKKDNKKNDDMPYIW